VFTSLVQRLIPPIKRHKIWTRFVRLCAIVGLPVNWKDAVVELPRLYLGYRFASMRRTHTKTSWTGKIHRDVRVVVVSEDVYVLVTKSIFEDDATDFCWER